MRKKFFLLIMLCCLYSCTTTSFFSSDNKFDEKISDIVMKVVKKDKNQQEIEIQEREELTQGDKFAVWVTTRADTYVYIFRVDSNQKRVRLFPNPNYSNKNSFLKSDAIIRVPDNGRWLEVSGNKGIEEIFVLAQKEPLADPDIAFEQVLKSQKGVDGKRKGYPPSGGGGFTDLNRLRIEKFYFSH